MNEVTLSCMICTYSDSDRSWKLTPSTSASGPIKYISTLLQLRGGLPNHRQQTYNTSNDMVLKTVARAFKAAKKAPVR